MLISSANEFSGTSGIDAEGKKITVSENASAQPVAAERKKLGIALKRVAAQEDWVAEAYVSEAMDLGRYKEDMDKLTSH
ncbi:MAG: hypothetical protein VYC83_06435, partial [Chloroflexota bacterium]|nr:hypothetical protein [Chloroflexota bacterium]